MDDKKKRKLIRRYFKPSKLMPVAIVLGLAGVVTIMATQPANDARPMGWIAIGVAVLLIVVRVLRKSPSHAQIDEWLATDLERLAGLALSKLDIDEEDLVSEPLRVIGPVAWKTNGIPDDELRFRVEKRGKRKWARYAVYHVTEILLTDSHLGVYEADFNFMRNTFLNEHAQEFHYQDVVSVSVREDSTNLSLASGQKAVHGEQFRLSVSSGENVSVVVRSPELRELTGADEDTSEVEGVVRAIRKMLREKKQTVAAE